MTVNDIREYLLREGYRAKLAQEDEETALINSSVDGVPFSIVFYRESPPDGDLDAFYSYQFSAGVDEEKDPNLLALNQLNAENRFFKAYADSGVIWIETDHLVSSDELTEQMFSNAFGWWTTFLHEMIKSPDDPDASE